MLRRSHHLLKNIGVRTEGWKADWSKINTEHPKGMFSNIVCRKHSKLTSFNPGNFNVHTITDGYNIQDYMLKEIKQLSVLESSNAFTVTDLGDVLEKHLDWKSKLPLITPFYAMKANPSPPILAMLNDLGTGFDCASQAELQLALSLGVTPDRIIYANPCKQDSHLKYACKHGVQMMTFDSEEELLNISQSHNNAKLVLRIYVDDSASALRLSSKFGAPLDQCPKLLERAKGLGLNVIGVSFHVGVSCKDPKTYSQAISDAHRAFHMGFDVGFNMTLLDIGGGFPGPRNVEPKFQDFASEINLALAKWFPAESGVKVIAEPGTYYVSSASTLAVAVIGKKVVKKNSSTRNDEDVCIMYYVNDGSYGSFNVEYPEQFSTSVHQHKKLKQDGRMYSSVIWGPTCGSDDCPVPQCILPELERGDWLLVDNMGAYNDIKASNFNGFPKAVSHFVMLQQAWCKMQKMCAGIRHESAN